MSKQTKPSALISAAVLLNGITDPRAPKADVTNAAYLMGEVFQGDASQYPYGDVNEEDYPYGDVSTAGLDVWNTLIGDAYDDDPEVGALRLPKLGPKGKKIAAGIGIAAGATGLGLLAARAIKAAKTRKAVRAAEKANSAKSTIANQIRARRMMGKISPNQLMPFYQISGATLNQFPLAPTENFPASSLRYNMDRQSADTPFESELVQATFAGVTWTATSVGVAANRFYCAVFLSVGIAVINANPGTVFSITGTFPTVNGTLIVAANPWSFTMLSGFHGRFMVFPWQLVTNKALLALGQYNAATPIIMAVTGIPATGNVVMIIPGSLHPWTIAMRNAMS